MTQRNEHSWKEWLWKKPHTGLSHDANVSFMLQTRETRLGMFLFCASRLRHQYSRNSTSLSYRHDVISSTRGDMTRRRHMLLRWSDSSLNHEWSKTASFISCLDACLDAVGVRPHLDLLSSCILGVSLWFAGGTREQTILWFDPVGLWSIFEPGISQTRSRNTIPRLIRLVTCFTLINFRINDWLSLR
jgi:hypothetical protein